MFYKKSYLLSVAIILMGVLAFAPLVFAAPPESSQLKIFSRDRETIESVVNEWLASQKNITVDQIKASAYGNEYAVLISYRAGGGGKVLTRVKIFDSNALSGGAGDNNKTPEARGQELISLLGENQIIRSADILAGSGPWDIFVVYDERNPIKEEQKTEDKEQRTIIEEIKTFVENLVNPSPEPSPAPEASPEKSVRPVAEQGEATTPTTPTTTDTSATTTEEQIEQPQEQIQKEPSAEPTEVPTEQQSGGEALAASILTAVGLNTLAPLFNNWISDLVILFLILAAIFSINKALKKWEGKK